MGKRFTDQEAAIRLLNRLAREIAAYVDDGDTNSAEDLAQEKAVRWLKEVAEAESEQ